MASLDDEKGGQYHGPYAWPGGVPIPTVEEIAENKKNSPIIMETREEAKRLLEENIRAEFPLISEEKVKELTEAVWLKIS